MDGLGGFLRVEWFGVLFCVFVGFVLHQDF